MVVIYMPYIGKVISINGYKLYDRKGKPTNNTHPQAKRWMGVLTKQIKEHPEFETIHHKDVTIRVNGFFKDRRYPDLHNLHKVIGDAVEPAIEVNDKYIKFIDGKVSIGHENPILTLEIFPTENS